MLTQEQINEKKSEFLSLVEGINREGMNKEELIKFLESSDFFYAPASTKYHGCYPGGLCEHSLDVYILLTTILKSVHNFNYDEDTIRIVSLFHDFSKVNLYKKDIRNKKVYHEYGSKSDNLGRFDWVSEEAYSIDKDNRFMFGNHEETSEFLTRQFIPLSPEESVALLHHHGGMGWDSTRMNMSEIYTVYKLAVYLHSADLLASFTTYK